MGDSTRSELIAEGLKQAGAGTNLSTTAIGWLRSWLTSQYKAWNWPFLRKTKTGYSLPAGTTSLLFGSGQGGESDRVQRILNPIWIGASGYGTRSKAPIINLDIGLAEYQEQLNDPAAARGLPTGFKVRATVAPSGKTCWELIPFPLPDRTYLVSFDYMYYPADPCPNTTSIPLYPNDETMEQAIQAAALRHMNGPADESYQASLAELNSMVVKDRITDGQVDGTNDLMRLDPDVFL